MSDVVVVSLEAWDQVWRRNQQLATALLARDPGLRILFVEPDQDLLNDLRRRRRPARGASLAHLSAGESEYADRVWRWSATKLAPRKFDRTYDERWAGHVQRAARRLGFADPVLWVNDPRGAAVARRTGWSTVYDITDDWLAARRTTAERSRLATDEKYLLDHAAQVTVCSPALAARKSGRVPATLITNAVDAPFLRAAAPRPADLPEGAAVYVGTVHEDRLDVPLTAELARRVGPANVVLIGPNALSPQSDSALRSAGVRLLGARPYRTLPGYLQHAGALILPHLVDDFTESLDPIKLYEYLAVGRPIVSTPVAGFRDRPEVTVAQGPLFVEAVGAALAADDHPAYVAKDLPTWQGQGEKFALALEAAARG